MYQIIKKVYKYWPVILLLTLTFLLRIYKIEELFYFTYDEAIPAFVGRRLIIWNHIPLIGGVTPFGFHLAPYFYWILAAFLFIGNLNPIVWGYAGAAIAVLTTLLMYIVGKEYFGEKVGFLAGNFWAFSYLANIYDRHFWALYWGPLVSLITIYFLYKIIKKNEKFTYLLGVTLAFAIHVDLSNLLLIVLSSISWIIFKIPFKKSTLIALLIIIASFAPLVAFDFRHDFANSKPAIEYFEQGKQHAANNYQNFWQNSLYFPITFSRLIYASGGDEISKIYSYCTSYVSEKYHTTPKILTAATSLIITIFLIKSLRASFQFQIIGILIILYFVGIQLFGTIFRSDIFEHYITGLFPVFLLILAYFVSKLPYKLWFLALTLFIFFNLQKLLLAKNSMGLLYKKQAIEYTMQQVGSKDFSLESVSTCWKYSGYRYLFAVFGREPTKSYVDPNFAYLYGTTPVSRDHPDTVVAFVTHDFNVETKEFYKRYAELKSHEVSSTKFGNIETIIMDNSSGWFY